MFKIGDIVKIKDRIAMEYTKDSYIKEDVVFFPQMSKFIGKVAVIHNTNKTENGEIIYQLRDLATDEIIKLPDYNIIFWKGEWLEPYLIPLNVGTKVIIKKHMVFNNDTPEYAWKVGLNLFMKDYLGKVATVVSRSLRDKDTKNPFYIYKLDIDNERYVWVDYFFSKVVEG